MTTYILAVLTEAEWRDPEYQSDRVVSGKKFFIHVNLNHYDARKQLLSRVKYCFEGKGDDQAKDAIQNLLLGKYHDIKREMFATHLTDQYFDFIGVKKFLVDLPDTNAQEFFDDLFKDENWSVLLQLNKNN